VAAVVALDVGTKTIGVAACDPLRISVRPVRTLKRKGVKSDAVALARVIEELGSEVIVVGLPLELDGTEARSARLARQIGAAIGEKTGLPVQYCDERYSSVDAERELIEANVSRARRKEVIDQAAAMVILRAWLRLQ